MFSNTKRKGFTLIELLIVVVIIGILAAIAIPKFATTKEKAYVAAMKSDLKNLATAQESYFSDNNTYATLAQIQAAPYSWAPSGPAGTAVPLMTANNATGWGATITDGRVATATTNTCGVFAGAATNSPDAAVTVEGVPACY